MTRLHVSPISGNGALIYRSGNALAYLVGVPITSLDKVAGRLANAEPVAWMAVLQAFQVTGAAVIDESNDRTRLRYTGMVEIQVLNGSSHPNEPDGSLYVGTDDVRIMHLSVDDRLRINPRPDAMGIGNLEGGSMAVDSLFIRVGELDDFPLSESATMHPPGPGTARVSIPLPPVSPPGAPISSTQELIEPDPTVFHVPLRTGDGTHVNAETQVIDIVAQAPPATVDVSPPDTAANPSSAPENGPVATASSAFVVEPPTGDLANDELADGELADRELAGSELAGSEPSEIEPTVSSDTIIIAPEPTGTDGDADAPADVDLDIDPDLDAESDTDVDTVDSDADLDTDADVDTGDSDDSSHIEAEDEAEDDTSHHEAKDEAAALPPGTDAENAKAQGTATDVDDDEAQTEVEAVEAVEDADTAELDEEDGQTNDGEADDTPAPENDSPAPSDTDAATGEAEEEQQENDESESGSESEGYAEVIERSDTTGASESGDAAQDDSDLPDGDDGPGATADDDVNADKEDLLDEATQDDDGSAASPESTDGTDDDTAAPDGSDADTSGSDDGDSAEQPSEPGPTVFLGASSKSETGFDAPYQPSFKKVPLITKTNEAIALAAQAEGDETDRDNGGAPRDDPFGANEAGDASGGLPSDQTCVNGHRNTPTAALCSTCGERLDAPADGGRIFMRPGVVGTLTFDDGEQFDISNDLLIGRAPGTPVIGDTAEFPSDPMMSREHFRIEVDDHSVIVRDLNSSNGTMVRFTSDGGYERLLPGEAYPLSDGAVIVAGQRWATFALHLD